MSVSYMALNLACLGYERMKKGRPHAQRRRNQVGYTLTETHCQPQNKSVYQILLTDRVGLLRMAEQSSSFIIYGRLRRRWVSGYEWEAFVGEPFQVLVFQEEETVVIISTHIGFSQSPVRNNIIYFNHRKIFVIPPRPTWGNLCHPQRSEALDSSTWPYSCQ